jgi:hypothetical protein
MHIIKPFCHKYEILFSAKLVGEPSRRHALLFSSTCTMYISRVHVVALSTGSPSLTSLLHSIEVASLPLLPHFIPSFFSSVAFIYVARHFRYFLPLFKVVSNVQKRGMWDTIRGVRICLGISTFGGQWPCGRLVLSRRRPVR